MIGAVKNRTQVGVLGASGYTGAELVRLLSRHPEVELRLLTAERHAGQSLDRVFPHLGGLVIRQEAEQPICRTLLTLGLVGVALGVIAEGVSCIDLDNIVMHQNFLGGADENWFVLVHVAIEAEAGVLLDNAAKLVTVCRDRDEDTALALLTEMDEAWERIYAHFARMPERCDPYIYFHRVRPYIHGWANNPALDGGLVYEGIEKFGGKPQALRGQTGSQSSIVPAMDALFQVGHSDDPLKSFLDELHAYRPVEHRRFIEDLAAQSTLRSFVAESGNAALKEAFNACLEQAARFRTRHLEYAASYINKQAGSIAGNDPDVGTGGTPFMKYLKKHRDENRAQVVD